MNLYQLRQIIRDYYSNNFNLKDLEKIIDLSNFATREFGFVSLTGKFFRNISFDSPQALHDFLIEKTPTDAYIGAVYDFPPSREHPIHTLEWKGHELVFDIDLTEYDAVRKYVCDCQGADQVCRRCWQKVNLAIQIIDETLRLDFGLNKVLWVYSGRRGVHGWVIDNIGFQLNQEQRKSIVDYLSVVQGEGETARVNDRTKLRYDFRKRIEYAVFNYFLQSISLKDSNRLKDLIDLGFSRTQASNFISRLEYQDGTIDENFKREFNKALSDKNKYDEILRRWVPRIDHKVTIDLRRLLRLPQTIHSKTGNIARLLDPDKIFQFNPENERSLFKL